VLLELVAVLVQVDVKLMVKVVLLVDELVVVLVTPGQGRHPMVMVLNGVESGFIQICCE
jgi:hypothetical protein